MTRPDPVNHARRNFLGTAAAAAGLGGLLSSRANATHRPADVAPPSLPSLGPLRQVEAGELDVGYVDAGPVAGRPVILLHGWPYDIHSFAEVVPLLTDAGHRVIVPYLRGYGTTMFRSAEAERNAQQSALAADAVALMDALNISQAVIAGFDWGARTANIVAALWPERCRAMVSVSGYLIGSQAANRTPLPPRAEHLWWYQYYFATERGRLGYERNRDDFARLIWRTASPRWDFDDATFARSAQAFQNPDHAAIVIHNYRWRLGLAEGEARYDAFERQLAQMPDINVPSVTLQGDADGSPHPEPAAYAGKFRGRYVHRRVEGGIGHNLPQEAPRAFRDALLEAASFA